MSNHSALHILTCTSRHTLVARLQSTAVAAPTDHQMLHPPSTTRFWPVSQSLASLESSATAPLMSRDRPVTCSLRIRPTQTAPALGQRPMQQSVRVCFGPHGFIWRVRSTISGRCVPILGIWPGERQFTWMPCAASSTASERVRLTCRVNRTAANQRVVRWWRLTPGRGLRRTTAPLAAW